LVGINVAVTNPDCVGACASSTPIEMQEDSKRIDKRKNFL